MIEGLSHSGVIENSYTAPVIIPSSGSSGGGSCYTEWACANWSGCLNGSETRVCEKERASCSIREVKPNETRSCVVEVVAEVPSEAGGAVEGDAEELNAGLGLGAVTGTGRTGSVALIVVALIVVAGVAVTVNRRKGKK